MSKDQTKKNLSRVNVKKKVWYKLRGPKLFGQMELGETYLSAPEEAVGRVMKINLKDLTGNVKDQNVYIGFKIEAVEGTSLQTSVIGYELTATYVKKMVRKNTNRMDDYFMLSSRDGRRVVLKTLMITQNKAQRSVQKQLREKLRELLAEELRQSSFEMFVGNLVSRKVHMILKKTLHKIYPLNDVAIRMLRLQKGEAGEVPAVEEAPMEEMPAEEETPEAMEESADEEAAPAA